MKIPQNNREHFNSFVYNILKLPKYDLGKTIQFLKRADCWEETFENVSTENKMIIYINENLTFNNNINYQILSFETFNTVEYFKKFESKISTSSYRYFLETKKLISDYKLKITQLELGKQYSFSLLQTLNQETNFKEYESIMFDLEKFNDRISFLKSEQKRLERLINNK